MPAFLRTTFILGKNFYLPKIFQSNPCYVSDEKRDKLPNGEPINRAIE